MLGSFSAMPLGDMAEIDNIKELVRLLTRVVSGIYIQYLFEVSTCVLVEILQNQCSTDVL